MFFSLLRRLGVRKDRRCDGVKVGRGLKVVLRCAYALSSRLQSPAYLWRDDHAHSLFRSRIKLDAGTHRLARDRRAVRGAADVVRWTGSREARVSGYQSRRQGPHAADRWPQADRGRCDPALFRQAISGGIAVAGERSGSRGAGNLLDVVQSRDAASGAQDGHRSCHGDVDARGSTAGRAGMDAGAVLDRGHPSVSAVLAAGQFAAAGARNLPEPLCALSTHDGASGSAANLPDRSAIGYELPPWANRRDRIKCSRRRFQ